MLAIILIIAAQPAPFAGKERASFDVTPKEAAAPIAARLRALGIAARAEGRTIEVGPCRGPETLVRAVAAVEWWSIVLVADDQVRAAKTPSANPFGIEIATTSVDLNAPPPPPQPHTHGTLRQVAATTVDGDRERVVAACRSNEDCDGWIVERAPWITPSQVDRVEHVKHARAAWTKQLPYPEGSPEHERALQSPTAHEPHVIVDSKTPRALETLVLENIGRRVAILVGAEIVAFSEVQRGTGLELRAGQEIAQLLSTREPIPANVTFSRR